MAVTAPQAVDPGRQARAVHLDARREPDGSWIVSGGKEPHRVDPGATNCDCADHRIRLVRCKHLIKVAAALAAEEEALAGLDGRFEADLAEHRARNRDQDAPPPEHPDDRLAVQFPPPVCLLGAAPPEPLRPLGEGFLLEHNLNGFFGEDESYKSTASCAVSVAVAGGLPIFSAFATDRPRRVLIVSGEDELGVSQNRCEALIVGMGWEEHRALILGNIYVHALSDLLLDDPLSQAHLLALRESLGIELMVFDPLADLMNGDEQLSKDARPVKRFWRTLIALGCSVLVVHHYGKPSEGKTDRDRIRGTSAWISSMRAAWGFKRSDDGIAITCLKMSRSKRPEPFELELEVTAEEGNATMWREARLTTRGAPGDWKMTDRRTMTPSDRKALGALYNFQDEALSWTRWMALAGISESALGRSKGHLVELGYIVAVSGGLNRFKRQEYRYSITGEGISAHVSVPDSQTPAETPAETPMGASAARLPDSHPPLQGGESEAPAGARKGARDSHSRETGSLKDRGDAWEGDAA